MGRAGEKARCDCVAQLYEGEEEVGFRVCKDSVVVWPVVVRFGSSLLLALKWFTSRIRKQNGRDWIQWCMVYESLVEEERCFAETGDDSKRTDRRGAVCVPLGIKL